MRVGGAHAIIMITRLGSLNLVWLTSGLVDDRTCGSPRSHTVRSSLLCWRIVAWSRLCNPMGSRRATAFPWAMGHCSSVGKHQARAGSFLPRPACAVLLGHGPNWNCRRRSRGLGPHPYSQVRVQHLRILIESGLLLRIRGLLLRWLRCGGRRCLWCFNGDGLCWGLGARDNGLGADHGRPDDGQRGRKPNGLDDPPPRHIILLGLRGRGRGRGRGWGWGWARLWRGLWGQ
mmetsp:Transcript_14419/g.26103  ORF Transcript_14419/g.26103 Transcript_14419/m.26103 type:complete len:231 (+) Transcript_14419:861-1553(+)